jgi:CHAT domain-containing protein
VAGDPDFDLAGMPSGAEPARTRAIDRSAISFGRLPGTHDEGVGVAKLLGVDPWLEGDVLESAIKQSRSPRILHLATHGFFLPDTEPEADPEGRGGPATFGLRGQLPANPLLRSGLALAGANTWLRAGTPPAAAEDGLLTAEDVTGLDLGATELVVLSACETGLGEVRRGEGVFGLRRAFVLAGARTLIMSLWKVPDRQTRELMEDLYGRLLNGTPRAEALRQAQLAMSERYPHPVFWGAFICQGEPGPLATG